MGGSNKQLRRRARKIIPWTTLELQGLLEDEDSHVMHEKHKHISLFPIHLNNINDSIRKILDNCINSFDRDFDGLLLAYENPRVMKDNLRLHHDNCQIHMDIEADFYVFKPKIGVTLKGNVNKCSPDHIGIIVHKVFIVSIPKPEDDDNWPGERVKVGQEIRFTVEYLDLRCKIPYIKGVLHEHEYLKGCKLLLNEEVAESVEPIHQGKKRKLCFNGSENASASAVRKKRRNIESEFSEGNKMKLMNSLDRNSESIDQKSQKKTHKLKKERLEINSNLENQDDENDQELNFDFNESREELKMSRLKVPKLENHEESNEASSRNESVRKKKKQSKMKLHRNSLEDHSIPDLNDRKPLNLVENHTNESELEERIGIVEDSVNNSQERRKKSKVRKKNAVSDLNLDIESHFSKKIRSPKKNKNIKGDLDEVGIKKEV